jgi:hypothetical protein
MLLERRLLGALWSLGVCLAPVGPLAGEHDAGSSRATATEGGRLDWQIDVNDREAVRQFWRARFRDTPPSGFWQGGAGDCDPGATLQSHRRDTMARINAFRALAGVPADMEEDPAASRKAQAAALVVARNGRIAHSIDAGWTCYSDDARDGASVSLLGLGHNGTDAITDFMRDAGAANGGAKHRRWLLFPKTKFMGMGDVPGREGRPPASGFTAFDDLYNGNRPPVRDDFVAWPPAGWLPYQLVFARWTFSLVGADFSAAELSLSRDGEPVAVTREPASDGAGEPTLVWRPEGLADDAAWPRPTSDTRYDVHLANVKVGDALRQFNYTVQVFDPDAPNPGRREANMTGPAHIPRTGANFTVVAPPGATGLQWRAMKLAAASESAGAEQGFGDFSYSGSNDYPVVQSTVVAHGRQAFRLSHNHIGNEVLVRAQPLVAGPATRLQFNSRRAIAGSDEMALVEVQQDGSPDWIEVWRQQGDGRPVPAEAAFSRQTVDLAAYANRLLRLRFRYAFAGGSFFSPDDARVGWYLDDIRLENAWQVTETTAPAAVLEGQVSFQPGTPGEWRLQARPMVYGAEGDWGPLWPVSVE